MSVCLNKALDRACRRFDADGSGTISRAELTRALRSLGVPVRSCVVPGASRLCWRRFCYGRRRRRCPCYSRDVKPLQQIDEFAMG